MLVRSVFVSLFFLLVLLAYTSSMPVRGKKTGKSRFHTNKKPVPAKQAGRSRSHTDAKTALAKRTGGPKVNMKRKPVPEGRIRKSPYLNDIIYTQRQKAMLTRHGVVARKDQLQPQMRMAGNPARRWPNNRIPFLLSLKFTEEESKLIFNALVYLNTISCFKFEMIEVEEEDMKQKEIDEGYVKFKIGDRCSSSLGRRGGKQIIWLARETEGIIQSTVLHEAMHAMGLEHEHQRADCDHYVKVHWNNIAIDFQESYARLDFDTFGLPYDYSSIMHYDAYAGSNGNGPSMTATQEGVSLNWITALSKLDIQRINLLGGC